MFPLASEARLPVLLGALAAVLASVALGLYGAAPLWLVWLIFVFLVREAPRQIPARPLANVSPVDGRVMAVEETTDPFLSRPALRVRIKQSWLGELNIRSPTEGKVKDIWSPHDDQPAASASFAFWVRTDEGDDVVLAVDLGGGLRWTRSAVSCGERLGQGQRCALIGFARVFDVYLPPGSRVEVERGERVTAGRDIVASLVHRSARSGGTLGA